MSLVSFWASTIYLTISIGHLFYGIYNEAHDFKHNLPMIDERIFHVMLVFMWPLYWSCAIPFFTVVVFMWPFILHLLGRFVHPDKLYNSAVEWLRPHPVHLEPPMLDEAKSTYRSFSLKDEELRQMLAKAR